VERQEIFLQGHRGCRGLFPENSLSAFRKAFELGVDAIELDVVVSNDEKIIVSHEPFMDHLLCKKPDGSAIAESEAKSLNLYKMKAVEIAAYSFGELDYPKFPNQKKVKSHKLSLLEVVKVLGTEWEENFPQLTIEIKSHKSGDNKYHPDPESYAEIFMQTLDRIPHEWPIAIQSFDARILKALDALQVDLPLIYLNDKKEIEVEEVCEDLKFVPEGWGSAHELIDENLIDACFELGLELSAWTVNDKAEAERLFGLGVRNFITDYPNLYV
jgi:glycerophosphoryl diester phosphodiesterase